MQFSTTESELTVRVVKDQQKEKTTSESKGKSACVIGINSEESKKGHKQPKWSSLPENITSLNPTMQLFQDCGFTGNIHVTLGITLCIL